jgi:hypothetical protein
LEPALKVTVEETLIHIPSLEGIVLLKLVAYSERPEDRENDITVILGSYIKVL